MESFMRCLYMTVHKASKIALALRSRSDVFNNVVQEKASGHGKNERFAQDFKTLADVLIQEVVKHDLGLKAGVSAECVRGEEDSEITLSTGETVHMKVGAQSRETAELLRRVFHENELAEYLAAIIHGENENDVLDTDFSQVKDLGIDLSDVGIWIDPIDGTNEYIKGGKGHYENNICEGGLPVATVLVGVYSLTTGVPFAGVVGYPFDPELSLSEASIRVVWGVAHDGVRAASANLSGRPGGSRVIVLSSSESAAVKAACEKSRRAIRYAAGSGYKLMCVVEGWADAYLMSNPSTYKWDTCAPHAILRALGGDVVDKNGKPVLYSKPNENGEDAWCNSEGVVAFSSAVELVELLEIMSSKII